MLNVGGYAKKCAIFSQISTANAPLFPKMNFTCFSCGFEINVRLEN